MPRTTIADVARVSGFSQATVSRVLMGQAKHIREDTRQRILETVESLGYHPSNAARSLKSKRSCTLGVVGYGLEYYGPSCTLSGIEQEASRIGYTILLQLIRQPETNNVAQLLQEMSSRYVDGIIWAVPEIADNRAWLKEKSCKPTVPVVFLTMETQPDQVIVAVDNYGGALLVTRHLITQGCQNIGLITGPMDWWEARERKRGWRDALESVGLPASESLVAEGNWSTSSGEDGLASLLSRHPELDGLFACNDRMALGALKTAREHHLRVPEDLAIVGFDDMPDTTYYCPALSTVRQDMIELGRLAVRELGRAIEEHQSDQPLAPKTVLLQPELLVRESSRLRKP